MRMGHIFMWPTLLHNIFSRYLIRGRICGKVSENKMYVLIFSTNLSKIFLILRRGGRDIITNVRSSCQILMKLEFSRQIFEKILEYKMSQKSFQWEPRCSCGRTDWHVKVNSSFSISCERAWKQILHSSKRNIRRSQWPRGPRRGSAAARLLRLWSQIPPRALMFVCCECCVLWGRGLCDKPITRQEESYRLWCVVVCDLESSWMRRPWPTGGCCAPTPKKLQYSQHRCCQPTAG